ncbi:hypothetical protein BGZ60DRAFT_396239 [Tricladium varicosporioides]|nr:hypothetical protein BGZ60DRAFT_396239 [Hymenoscyphus varicosporioides]
MKRPLKSTKLYSPIIERAINVPRWPFHIIYPGLLMFVVKQDGFGFTIPTNYDGVLLELI